MDSTVMPQRHSMDLMKLKPLPVLDFSHLVTPRLEDEEYFRFYGIDFENRYRGVTHYFGAVSVREWQIATHYYRHKQEKTLLFVLHGYFDHAGLFGKIIDWGLQQGFSVLCFDLPGHGLSDGDCVSIDDFAAYGEVLATLVDSVKPQWDNSCYLVAQSTGCTVVMEYLLSRPHVNPFQKIMFLAPLVRPKHWAWIRLQLLFGRRWIASVRRRFVRNSHDDTFLKFIERDDPLQAKIVSVKWILALQRWHRKFESYQNRSDVELMVLQGTGDGTVDWRYNLQRIQKKFPKMVLHKIQNARHHMANESRQYFDQMRDYMNDYFLQ